VTEQVTPSAPEEPERKRGIGRIVLTILGVIVVLVVYAVVKYGFREVVALVTGSPTKAKAGDCVTASDDAKNTKIVDCSKPEAAFKVSGVVDDKTRAEAEAVCQAFPAAERYLFRWEGDLKDDTKGQVLCLEPNKK
jgi:hypothetical protein